MTTKLIFQVIEDFFFKEKPFSTIRHVAVTMAIVFSSMASESLWVNAELEASLYTTDTIQSH